MVLNTASSISLSQLNATAFFSNGKMGINTTNPTADLDVNGVINSTGLTTGNINFTGSLYQNGIAYVGSSQWTTTAGNVSYTSGSVVATNAVLTNATLSNTVLTNATINNFSFGTNVTVNNLLATNLNLGVSSMYSGSFIASNNVISATDVTGFSFANANIRSFNASVSISIVLSAGNSLYGMVNLNGAQNASGWSLFSETMGDTTGIAFTITNSGQVQYTSTNQSNWSSTIFRFSAQQFSATGTYSSLSANTQGSYIMDSIQLNSTEDAVSGVSNGPLYLLGGATITKTLNANGGISTGTINASTGITTATAQITNVSSTTISVGTLLANTITGGNLSLSGNLIVAGTLTTVNITSTNLVDTNISAGSFNATTATIPNLVATNVSTGTLNVTTGITTASLVNTGLISTSILSATNSSLPNSVHTNISTNTISASVGITTGSLLATGLVSAANLASTTATIPNIINTNISSGTINVSTGITTGGLLATGLVSAANLAATTATIPNIINTNVSTGVLIASTGITSGNINSTGLTTGNINFTGSLFQNGTPYLGSQWTTTAGNVSYTSGAVVGTNMVNTNISSGTINVSTGITTAALLTTGLISSANLASTNATVGVLNVSTGITTGTLRAISLSTLSNVTSTNETTGVLIATTGITTGTINATGLSTLLNATATNISAGVLIASTGITTGSVKATGAISIGGANSVALTTQISSDNYNFNLPTSSGTAGQVLVSGGGGSNPMTWGTNVAPAVLARFLNTTQTISNNTNTIVLYDTTDSVNSTGVTGLSYSNGVFTNTTSSRITLIISSSVGYSFNTTGARLFYIQDASGNQYGFQTLSAANTPGQLNGNPTATLTLAASGTFSVYTLQTSGGNLNLLTGTTSGTRIQISVVNGGFVVPGNGGSLMARYASSGQGVANNTTTTITFDTLDTNVSVGYTGITYSGGTFTNANVSPITVVVTVNITWPGTISTSLYVTVSGSSRRYGFVSATTSYQGTSCVFTVPASGTFQVIGYQGSGSTATLYSDSISATSIQITPISGYSGNINATGITTGTLRATSNLIAVGNSNTVGSLYTTGGNVGVGTVTPAENVSVFGSNPKFSVYGTEGETTSLLLGTPYLSIRANGLKTGIIAKSATGGWNRADLHFCSEINASHGGDASVSNSRMMISGTTGNIGINTTNPSEILHVNGNIKNTGFSYVSTSTLTTGAAGTVLIATAAGGLYSGRIAVDAVGGGGHCQFTIDISGCYTENLTANAPNIIVKRSQWSGGTNVTNITICTAPADGSYRSNFFLTCTSGVALTIRLLESVGGGLSLSTPALTTLTAGYIQTIYPIATNIGHLQGAMGNYLGVGSGGIGINTSNPSYTLDVNGSGRIGAFICGGSARDGYKFSSDSDPYAYFGFTIASGSVGDARLNVQDRSGNCISFYAATAKQGGITVSGGTTSYNTSSDHRLKENVVDLQNASSRVKQLKARRFNFISNPAKTVDGFIAHEAAEVVPEAVHGVKDAVDSEGNPIHQGIDQSKLVPLLTAALKESILKIETLEQFIQSKFPGEF